MMKIGDKPLWGLVTAFVGWEYYASQINRELTSHTLSDDIWRLQHRHPGARLLVGAGLGALAAHLLIFPPKIPGE